MQPSSYVPSFYFYKLAQAISGPYTALDAYQAGAIDANGNIIKPESSIDSFEYLVIKLKRIFEELPAGMTKASLQNYMATLQMFSEEVQEFNISKEQFDMFLEGYISSQTDGEVSYLELIEDMAVGGGGGAAGSLGTPGAVASQGGVMGYDPVMGRMRRRKPPVGLNSVELFDVPTEEYAVYKNAKAWKHVPDSETKNYIRRFMGRNKGTKVGIRSLMPETKKQEIFWINYPAQSFMEQFKINPSDFNLE